LSILFNGERKGRNQSKKIKKFKKPIEREYGNNKKLDSSIKKLRIQED
jgi:hypothetical protein